MLFFWMMLGHWGSSVVSSFSFPFRGPKAQKIWDIIMGMATSLSCFDWRNSILIQRPLWTSFRETNEIRVFSRLQCLLCSLFLLLQLFYPHCHFVAFSLFLLLCSLLSPLQEKLKPWDAECAPRRVRDACRSLLDFSHGYGMTKNHVSPGPTVVKVGSA